MWVFAVLGVGMLGLMTLLGSHDTVNVQAGKKYRFFWKVVPGLDLDNMRAFIAALSSSGVTDIDSSQGSEGTVGSFVNTVALSKQIVLGTPSMVIQDGKGGSVKLIFTKVEEVP